MKIKIIITLFILVAVGVFVLQKQGTKTPLLTTNKVVDSKFEDMTAIRAFMAEPNLELVFVNTSLPQPYFMVGKVTKQANGENIEKVDDWVRQVNVYDQKGVLNGQCATYEYHVDIKSHTVTAVAIRGLRPDEINALKNDGITCVSDSGYMPKIAKAEAEAIAKDYLKRAVPNLDKIWGQFTYSLQSNGESHQWLWEDKDYKLPEGLEGRPYSYPTIRITVDGNKQIQYWNTVPLFEK